MNIGEWVGYPSPQFTYTWCVRSKHANTWEEFTTNTFILDVTKREVDYIKIIIRGDNGYTYEVTESETISITKYPTYNILICSTLKGENTLGSNQIICIKDDIKEIINNSFIWKKCNSYYTLVAPINRPVLRVWNKDLIERDVTSQILNSEQFTESIVKEKIRVKIWYDQTDNHNHFYSNSYAESPSLEYEQGWWLGHKQACTMMRAPFVSETQNIFIGVNLHVTSSFTQSNNILLGDKSNNIYLGKVSFDQLDTTTFSWAKKGKTAWHGAQANTPLNNGFNKIEFELFKNDVNVIINNTVTCNNFLGNGMFPNNSFDGHTSLHISDHVKVSDLLYVDLKNEELERKKIKEFLSYVF